VGVEKKTRREFVSGSGIEVVPDHSALSIEQMSRGDYELEGVF
jgi:hypothetical protein